MDSRPSGLKEEDMIERVAKAMFTAMQERFHTGRLYEAETDALSEQPWERQPGMYKELDRYRARAAIEAMRLPTEAMIDAGAERCPGSERMTIDDEKDSAKRMYDGMIDAALKSPSGV